MIDGPLVSCLMVTRPVPERLPFLKQSIASYLRQTYRPRELVVVIDGRVQQPTTHQIRADIASLERDDIRVIEPAGALTLGALRNLSMASARGDVFCQWDDDDLCHPERIQRQLLGLIRSGSEGMCLQHVMQYFPSMRRLYCTNWISSPENALTASLICRRTAAIVYPETGPRSQLGEDRDVVRQLRQRDAYSVLEDVPHLYIYVSHGKNSATESHHHMLADKLSLSQGLLRRKEAVLREAFAAFDFGPGEVTVHGSNGPAFILR